MATKMMEDEIALVLTIGAAISAADWTDKE